MLQETIRKMPLFAGISEEDRNNLLKDAKLRNYTKGEHLFSHGDPVKFFYIVTSGIVQLTRETPDGREVTTDIISQGRTIGKKESFDSERKTHQMSAVATNDVTVLQFPNTWIKNAALKHPEIALNIIAALSEYAHLVELEAEHKTTMSVTQQLACFLQRMCMIHEFDPKSFQLPYSKSLIASRLGMQLETFSRALPKLEGLGIIVKGTEVKFTDPKSIEEHVCSLCSVEGECKTHRMLADKFK